MALETVLLCFAPPSHSKRYQTAPLLLSVALKEPQTTENIATCFFFLGLLVNLFEANCYFKLLQVSFRWNIYIFCLLFPMNFRKYVTI